MKIFKKSKIAQIYYYDPQSAGINVQSLQSESTPRRLTLDEIHFKVLDLFSCVISVDVIYILSTVLFLLLQQPLVTKNIFFLIWIFDVVAI